MRRKISRKPAQNDRDKLVAIIEHRFPDAQEWLRELLQWPNVNLDNCLKRVAEEQDDDLGHELAASLAAECEVIKEAERYTRLICSENRIGDEYKTLLDEEEKAAEQKRFFNQNACRAEFPYWVSRDLLTSEEAAALCYGKDPRRVSQSSLRKVPKNSEFRMKFESILDRLVRSQKREDLGMKGLISIKELKDWLEEHKIQVDQDFAEAISFCSVQKPMHDDPRDLHTLYKMLLALAWDAYGYEPWNGKSVSVSDILKDLKKSGSLSVNEKTWKKHLQAAEKFARGQGLIKTRLKEEKLPSKTP